MTCPSPEVWLYQRPGKEGVEELLTGKGFLQRRWEHSEIDGGNGCTAL
jgi:hypothetical protein